MQDTQLRTQPSTKRDEPVKRTTSPDDDAEDLREQAAILRYSINQAATVARKNPYATTSREGILPLDEMIGGADIVIPATGDSGALLACISIVQRHWPNARFEDAESGEKYCRSDAIPLTQVRQLFAYENASAEADWEADHPDSPPNSMLYLLLSADSVTAVVDDPSTPDMTALLDSMKMALSRNALSGYAAELKHGLPADLRLQVMRTPGGREWRQRQWILCRNRDAVLR
jgi:hypothetical protein